MASLAPDSCVFLDSAALVFPPCAAFEKPYDLGIVRRIVEREGCLEAMQQLLEAAKKPQQPRISGISKAPIVFQSIIDQIRSVSVQIVEDIDQWQQQQQAKAQATIFRWRGANYLLKMTADLDFLISFRGVPLLESLQVLRLTQNPFLAQLHLDHPALRESDIDSALHLFGNWVGDVSMRRVFPASRLLLRERDAEANRRQIRLQKSSDNPDAANSVHIASESQSNPVAVVAPFDPAAIRQQQQQRTAASRGKVQFTDQNENLALTGTVAFTPNPREAAMREDIALSRELISQMEHELGAMRDELAALQERLEDALLPDKRRRLQTRIGTLVNDLKFRSGDLYQRKNELKRKEAIYRSTKDQHRLGSNSKKSSSAPDSSQPESMRRVRKDKVYSSLFETTLLEDEQVRNDLVLRVNASLSKARAEERKSIGLATPSRRQQKLNTVSSEDLQNQSVEGQSDFIRQWGVREVQNFLDSLGLDNGSYGATFRAQGIDGALLVQATDRDLEELGVTIRLHRVRILAECKAKVS